MHTTSVRRLAPDHPDFLIAVRSMRRPPDHLYVCGPIPHGPAVAIVGTRNASDAAMRFTRQLSADLASRGVEIWSGGAAGIDEAAHLGAMDVNARTVVVMGTGFNHLYPADHHRLFEDVIAGGGTWLSPYDEAMQGSRWSFLYRNELMAACVQAVVLVQAPLRSGGRTTIAAARRLGRRYWVVAASPWDTRGAGCVAELVRGAPMFESAEQIVREIGLKTTPSAPRRPALPPVTHELTSVERRIVELVQTQPAHPDEICEKTCWSAAEVSATLLTLTLRHVLVQGSDGRFSVVT